MIRESLSPVIGSRWTWSNILPHAVDIPPEITGERPQGGQHGRGADIPGVHRAIAGSRDPGDA
jgi:hypothetical protein